MRVLMLCLMEFMCIYHESKMFTDTGFCLIFVMDVASGRRDNNNITEMINTIKGTLMGGFSPQVFLTVIWPSSGHCWYCCSQFFGLQMHDCTMLVSLMLLNCRLVI